MVEALAFLLIVLPFAAALTCLLLPTAFLRKAIVIGTGAVLAVCSLLLLKQGTVSATPEGLLGIPLDGLITFGDFGLLFFILYLGYKMKNSLVMGLAALQVVPLFLFEFTILDHHAVVTPSLYADSLSTIMVLIISIVGSLICIYGLPYMDEHEHHLHLQKSKQPRFFFFLVLFLGAMNGLVLSNNIMWMYFFWEITTLCSFMLIGHDDTEIARKNAQRALWINLLGGAAFLFGVMLLYGQTHTLDVQKVLASGVGGGLTMLPLAFLCFAGFTKAAQVPFQSWLTGAMVAPTPVSALLHSSTMVKAGVYLVVRLAPAYVGTGLSQSVAMFGAFTFLTASALAMGQSNGKKILAYSTIANLGMIIACAGVNTPAAITAAVMLIIFHAISKGLLFLCVGAIEQKIGSRDIEDMRGLYAVMPRTAIITIIGVITMTLPPFGVLLAKWMAIEASSANLLVVLMLALGSALNVVFWSRWAGILLSTSFQEKKAPEAQNILMRSPLAVLAFCSIFVSLLAPVIYSGLIDPMLNMYYKVGAYAVQSGTLVSKAGAFAVYPLFVALAVGFVYALKLSRRVKSSEASAPYLCGENCAGPDKACFRGPMGAPVPMTASNYYISDFFGEEKLTSYINLIAGALLLTLIGGVL